jgi:hypothetical protein
LNFLPGVVGDRSWVVESFHTVEANQLVKERSNSYDASQTFPRKYIGNPNCEIDASANDFASKMNLEIVHRRAPSAVHPPIVFVHGK